MINTTCPVCHRDDIEVKLNGKMRDHRRTRGVKGSPWCDASQQSAPLIADHLYDAGFVRDDSQGCIALDAKDMVCRARENRHQGSEYTGTDAGSMHEPKAYTGALDWHDAAEEEHA
jgi:hypothetical protein